VLFLAGLAFHCYFTNELFVINSFNLSVPNLLFKEPVSAAIGVNKPGDGHSKIGQSDVMSREW
jgi:hypothetical protein